MAKVKEDISRVRLQVDGKEAINQLGKLEMEAKDLRKEISNIREDQKKWNKEAKNLEKIQRDFDKLVDRARKLKEEGKQNTKAYQTLQSKINEKAKALKGAQVAAEKVAEAEKRIVEEGKKLDQAKSKVSQLREQLGVAGMTLGQLLRQQKELRREMTYGATKGTEAYDKLRIKLLEVNGAITQQRREMNGTQGFFSGLGKSIGSIAASAGIFVGLAGAIQGMRQLIGVSSEFEQSMSNLSAITGATGGDLAFLEKAAKDLGASYTFTASQAAKAFELIASKKPELLENREALVEVSKGAVILAQAAGIELPEAAEALTNTMNQFGATAEEAERYINALAAGSKFGAGNIEFLNDSIKRFGPVANTMKVSFEESVAMMEVFAEKGLESEKAGTMFRNILIELAKGADETNPQIVGMETALKNLSKQQLSTAELSKKFGAQNLVGAQIMVQSTARFEEFRSKVTDTNVAIEQAETRVQNFNGLMKEAQSIAEFYQITFGKLIQDAIAPFIRGIVDAAVGLKDFFDAADASKRAVDESTKSIETMDKKLNPLIERYDELRKKTTLSKDEQDELKTVIGQIATLVPTAATKFDEYGNAIGISTEKVNAFREAQIAANKILNDKAIKENQKELTKLEDEIRKVNLQLNRRNEDGDLVKLVNQQNGFQNIIKEVKLTGDEITTLQSKLQALQSQVSGRKLILANLTGEETPEMAEARERERQEAIAKAEQEALAEQEAARELARRKAAEAAAEARKKEEAEKKAQLERLKNDFVKHQEDVIKIARDFEISQMEKEKAELARAADKYLKLEEDLKKFHENKIISEEKFLSELQKLDDLKQQETDAIKKEYREKEAEERKEAQKKILEEIQKTEDLNLDQQHQRAKQKIDAHFDSLIELARKFGLDEVEIHAAKERAITALEKEQSAEKLKIAEREYEMKKQMVMTFANSAISFLGMVNSFSKDSGEFEKVMAIGNAAVKSGEAIANIIAAFSSKSITPIDLAVRIAGGIGVISANIATAVRSINRASFPDPPAEPNVSAQPTRGRISTPPRTSFFFGGPTSGGLGFGDQYGEFAGFVHKKEYVVPTIVAEDPWVANLLPAIESIRQDRIRGFATGGPTSSGPLSAPAPGMNTARMEMLMEMILKELSKKSKDPRAYLVYSDLEEMQQEMETLKNRYSA